MRVTGLLVATVVAGAILSSGPADSGLQGGTSDPSAGSAGGGAGWAASKWGDPLTDANAKDSNGRNKPALDAGSLATVTTSIGARNVWGSRDATGRAVTGRGVTVALLDTGVNTTVPGLNATGKVVAGPDLSLEANAPSLRGQDGFGHGTHLAGIIAGRDPVPVAANGEPRPADGSVQLGVAPDATLLSVKVGTRDGSTDVSQVIAGLDWLVQHRNDNGMRVRVINLSYGTLSTQAYQVDPLAAAAENAWKHSIVVVVSGGNEGTGAGRLTDPAIDPYVLATGSSDARAKPNGWNDPSVSDFSSGGTATRHVDLVAPGSSIASLRNPGSYIDVNYPGGQVAGDTTGRLFRGSGTSQAAAVTSGAVALLLQAYPDLTPDQVKAALVSSADKMSDPTINQGAGQLDIAAALVAAKGLLKKGDPRTQTFPESAGLGSLEAARGGGNLTDPETGAVLRGEIDVQNQKWNAPVWRAASVSASAWTGGIWNGARWSGDTWAGGSWTNSGWDGARWSGARWSSVNWSADFWSGARWSGARWSGSHWIDQDWQ